MAHEADTRVNRDARPKLHAGEGHLVSNIVTFVVLLAVFLLGFYVLQTATFTSVWELAASIAQPPLTRGWARQLAPSRRSVTGARHPVSFSRLVFTSRQAAAEGPERTSRSGPSRMFLAPCRRALPALTHTHTPRRLSHPVVTPPARVQTGRSIRFRERTPGSPS